ncbi:CxC2 domain-containing protein [Mycena kentingensis (nom. inval.)]|nr:CxC2 domain-containing protein [Mycena kentingensis (nom. inval.)]
MHRRSSSLNDLDTARVVDNPLTLPTPLDGVHITIPPLLQQQREPQTPSDWSRPLPRNRWEAWMRSSSDGISPIYDSPGPSIYGELGPPGFLAAAAQSSTSLVYLNNKPANVYPRLQFNAGRVVHAFLGAVKDLESLGTTHSFSIPNAPSHGLIDTFVETSKDTSRGKKRIIREPATVPASSPVKPPEEQPYSLSLWEDGPELLNTPTSTPLSAKPKKIRSSDPAMGEWVKEHREGFSQLCSGWMGTAIYRCCECSHAPLFCKECIATQHARNPLHWIERWTGKFFKRETLKSAGLRIQLGHAAGEKCLLPRPGNRDFTVIHSNGIHEVAIDFCGCGLHEHDYAMQLMHSSYYPATGNRPQTCATIACLDDFHALSLHGKTTAYDYYRALEYRTNGGGVKPLDRYKAFMRMARQYRHLLLLKAPRPRAYNRTYRGDAARRACYRLPCLCLYVLFIAMDACFRLKRRLVGGDRRDPGLGTGWAYLVEWEPYRQYLLTVTDQEEISTCTGLAALDHANTKFAWGYSVTGVGAGICARHEFVLANGVGDLQRGERYANMDYILASLLRHINASLRKLLSYDIACQWAKNLKERLLALPPLVRLRLAMDLCRFAVPKMHINAHVLLCRLLFHLGLIPGSGATDGEGIERLWAGIAGVAGSTKLSGHGARADQLDDHWTFWNWCKLLGLAKLLRRRLENTKAELLKQEDSFRVFSAQQAEHVPGWLQMVKDYEADGEKPNPYASSEPEGISEAAVRQALEEEDRKQAENGRAALHAVTPSEFIVLGLELEDEQRRVRTQAQLKRAANSTGDTIHLKPLRKKLSKGIKRLRELQATYSPTSLVHLSSLHIGDDVPAEQVPLLLPSALSKSERHGCRDGLVGIESRLRHAQCKSALAQLRHQLHIKTRLLIYKKHQSRHQGANTRSRALVARNELKIKAHADMYRETRAALCELEDGVVWPPLLASDIRCLEDPDEISKREARNRRQLEIRLKRQTELVAEGLLAEEDLMEIGDETEESEEPPTKSKESSGESRRTVSWIWTMAATSGSEASLQDSIRVEWCRAYARTRRWKEEVRILEEDAPKPWPDSAGDARNVEGKTAYAHKQIAIYREMIWRAEEVSKEKWRGKGYRKYAERERMPEGSEDIGDLGGVDKDADSAEDSAEDSGEDSEEGEEDSEGEDDDDDD